MRRVRIPTVRTLRMNSPGSTRFTLKARPCSSPPDPLTLVKEEMRAAGYAGDDDDLNVPLLNYVAFSSRFLQRPINVYNESQSASGKSFAVNAAVRLHPPEAAYIIDAGSPRALIYTDENFQNRHVVMSEQDSLPTKGPAGSAVRAIIQDAVMRWEVVEDDPTSNQFVTRLIEKPGPTGLITTGVVPLEAQLATRMLNVSIPDSPGLTRKIILAQAEEAANEAKTSRPVEAFHAFQRYLHQAGEKRVIVPFARVLAESVPVKR